jgi:hypothetical protein
MNRRDFFRSTAAALASHCFAHDNWRTFEILTRVEVLKPTGETRVWLPASLITDTPYQRTLMNRFSAPAGRARIVETKADGLAIVAAEFPASQLAIFPSTFRFRQDPSAPICLIFSARRN